MIILEFAARGDLRTFLIDCQPANGNAALLTPFDLASMAVDIASGMVFLSSHSFVHRDLAARYASDLAAHARAHSSSVETALSPPTRL